MLLCKDYKVLFYFGQRFFHFFCTKLTRGRKSPTHSPGVSGPDNGNLEIF